MARRQEGHDAEALAGSARQGTVRQGGGCQGRAGRGNRAERPREGLRQTVIAMVKDAELTEHANPGEASVYVLRGRVALVSRGESWEGRDGDLLIVPTRRTACGRCMTRSFC